MATEIDALYMGINNLATPIEFGAAPVLQEKTVTLTGSQQNITPDQNYDGLSKVVVPGVVGTARPGQVLSGYTFSGANNPTGANGSIVTRNASSETITAAKTYNAGYYPSGWTVTPGSSYSETLLWTNPNTSSYIATDTQVSLSDSLNNYDIVKIKYYCASKLCSVMVPISELNYYPWTSGYQDPGFAIGSTDYIRSISKVWDNVSGAMDPYKFYIGAECRNYDGQWDAGNGIIPYQIYGVKV